MSYERKRWHTHVFTSTYTADVSGVCSAMYELGGMTILHDPSGCNSTYTTHDEPRWYDSKSLMFVSGLDEMTAVMGDDSVLIRDAVRAAADLKPRFITLCGASIPHIISFDFKGVARLIERETGIPVLPVATDGLRSYISGAGLAFREWIRRFGNLEDAKNKDAARADGRPENEKLENNSPEIEKPETGGREDRLRKYGVNLLGVTPIDFSRQEIVDAMKQAFTDAGIPVNTCFAMGDSFETLTGVYRGAVNVVVSSAGRIPARFMKGAAGIPFVEGLPLGREMTDRLLAAVRETAADGKDRRIFEEPGTGETMPAKLYRMNLDGSNTTLMTSNVGVGLCYKDGNLYFSTCYPSYDPYGGISGITYSYNISKEQMTTVDENISFDKANVIFSGQSAYYGGVYYTEPHYSGYIKDCRSQMGNCNRQAVFYTRARNDMEENA